VQVSELTDRLVAQQLSARTDFETRLDREIEKLRWVLKNGGIGSLLGNASAPLIWDYAHQSRHLSLVKLQSWRWKRAEHRPRRCLIERSGAVRARHSRVLYVMVMCSRDHCVTCSVLREVKVSLEHSRDAQQRRADALATELNDVHSETARKLADKDREVSELRAELKLKAFESVTLSAALEVQQT